jgi:predicted Zn-dependent protease
MVSSRPLKASGRFFDGETALTHDVEIVLGGDRISITGPSIGDPRSWPLKDLRTAERVEPERPLRLRNEAAPGERLIVEDKAMIADVLARVPQLTRPVASRKILRYALITAAGLLIAAALAYGLLSLLPPAVAQLMPEEWRDRLGRQTEQSFVGSFPECKASTGLRAVGIIGSRLYRGNTEAAPDFTVKVYKIPIINAFTLPGGRVVLTGKLLEAAKTPEEVAGVLAHELGHVHHRHPEAALIRLMGLQVLISLATGTEGGGVVSNLAGLATFLRYTRAAEVAADDYAQEILNRAKIDPLGLKRFFESLKKLEEAARISVGPLSGMLATHPATDERIRRLEPLREGSPEPVMSDSDWRALQAICR